MTTVTLVIDLYSLHDAKKQIKTNRTGGQCAIKIHMMTNIEKKTKKKVRIDVTISKISMTKMNKKHQSIL